MAKVPLKSIVPSHFGGLGATKVFCDIGDRKDPMPPNFANSLSPASDISVLDVLAQRVHVHL